MPDGVSSEMERMLVPSLEIKNFPPILKSFAFSFLQNKLQEYGREANLMKYKYLYFNDIY